MTDDHSTHPQDHEADDAPTDRHAPYRPGTPVPSEQEHDPPHGEGYSRDSLPSALLVELREHVPFSVASVALGLTVVGTICVLGFAPRTADEMASPDRQVHAMQSARMFFHLFHPAHMLFSAAATTAMFCRYEDGIIKAIVIGLIGAIGVCGMSDIVVPHVSMLVLGTTAPLHICVWEHTWLVIPFAIVGALTGVAAGGNIAHTTIISHSFHVLASTMASIFYMVGPLGIIAWIDILGKIFVFVVLAVMVPCCLSDIVFPLLLSRPGRKSYGGSAHAH